MRKQIARQCSRLLGPFVGGGARSLHAGCEVVCVVAITLLVAHLLSCWDAIVLGSVALTVRGVSRRLYAVCAIICFAASFPPFSWPTVWFCLAPLVWMWREQNVDWSGRRVTLEAIAVGFAMGWLSTGFVRTAVPAWGWLLHSAACFVFSLQFIGIAWSVRLFRNRSITIAAFLSAGIATGCELLEAYCGVAWSVTSVSLPAARTPVSQWAAWVGPFGVSWIVYFVNFLLVQDKKKDAWHRWIGPVLGPSTTAALWGSGWVICLFQQVQPIPFSAMLVQPHLREENKTQLWRPWIALDRLTRSSLRENGPVDLVVWPESCLSMSEYGYRSRPRNKLSPRMTIQEFTHTLQPRYQTNCLVEVIMWRTGTGMRYGLEVPETRRFNCGCLVSPSGRISCHEKLTLVPFKEWVPRWFHRTWFGKQCLAIFQLTAALTPGAKYRNVSFEDRAGNRRTIAVSICYESLLPWLPQYKCSKNVDAIVHIVYDGGFADHPEVVQRQILACRYRAIETRRWNLVCSTWYGSAIISPTGKVVRELASMQGVLRSDYPR